MRPGNVVVVASVAVAAFGLALWLRGAANVWLTTGIAGALCIGLAGWSGGDSLLTRFRGGRTPWIRGILAGLAMSIATWALYPWASALMPGLAVEVERLYSQLQDPPGPVLALPVIALVVLAEELVWRGVVFEALEHHLPVGSAIVIAASAYAVPQLASGSWVLVALALGCGLVWTVQRRISGGLVVPTLTHLTWDVLIFVAFPVA